MALTLKCDCPKSAHPIELAFKYAETLTETFEVTENGPDEQLCARIYEKHGVVVDGYIPRQRITITEMTTGEKEDLKAFFRHVLENLTDPADAFLLGWSELGWWRVRYCDRAMVFRKQGEDRWSCEFEVEMFGMG